MVLELRRSRGRVIAIVGPDGSGKTTVAQTLVEALSSGSKAGTLHLGGPPNGTRLTRLPRALIIGMRKLLRIAQGGISWEEAKGRYPTIQALLDVCTAIDRNYLARQCHAQKKHGRTIIADRYPGRVPGAASGPRRSKGSEWMARTLHRLELRIYQSVPMPDVVIRLDAPVELTVLRNAMRPVPKAEWKVRASHEAARLLHFPGVPEFVFDTSLPQSQTIANVLDVIGGECAFLPGSTAPAFQETGGNPLKE